MLAPLDQRCLLFAFLLPVHAEDATVRDFKRQLKELQGCDDMTRELMVVDLFYNLEQLNDQKTLAEAGISAGAEVGTGQKGLSIDF